MDKIIIMKRFDFLLILSLSLFFVFSCASDPVPEPLTEAPPASTPAPAARPPAPQIEETFDPESITQEVYDSTLNEIREVIVQLNQICSDAGKPASADSSYNAWLTWLGNDYAAQTTDSNYLAFLSEQPALKSRTMVLTSQKDYFINVFAASRQNVKADEIEFLTPQRVKVVGLEYEEKSMPSSRELQQAMLAQGYEVIRVRNQTKMAKTNRIRYYVLEKTDSRWKIASLDED
jgi:hypothetical protein